MIATLVSLLPTTWADWITRRVQARWPDAAPPPGIRRTIRRRGIRARDRMISANLRLVALVERRTRRGGEQIDRLQGGALGLIRAAEKFDPERGYKFSTYAFWWIRKGIEAVALKMPAPSGIHLPADARDFEAAAVASRPALRVDGYVRDDSGDGGSFADLIPDDRAAPDLAAREALEAMADADPDGLALVELAEIDGARQAELAELEGVSNARIGARIRNARQRFRRMPEVAAALG